MLSVIVPVHQGSSALAQCLEALVASDLPRRDWELIVVDDGSTDASALTAARRADVVVRLPGGPRGPAYARNRGFEVARGRYTAFIDADVCVHTDVLRSMVTVLERDTEIGAVFGTYDSSPPAAGFVSQYRNLLRHYVHSRFGGDTDAFWAACGAVRSNVFAEAGMYDEWHFSRPQVEGVELGHRIRKLGHRIVLNPGIQATHLKAWSLSALLLAEVRDRGVPRARVLGKQKMRRGRDSDRLLDRSGYDGLALLTGLLCVAGFVVSSESRWLWGVALWGCTLLRGRRPLYGFFSREKGHLFAIGALLLNQLTLAFHVAASAFGWTLRHLIGEPRPVPVVEAFAEVGVETWPPLPVKREALSFTDNPASAGERPRGPEPAWLTVGTKSQTRANLT